MSRGGQAACRVEFDQSSGFTALARLSPRPSDLATSLFTSVSSTPLAPAGNYVAILLSKHAGDIIIQTSPPWCLRRQGYGANVDGPETYRRYRQKWQGER